MVGIAVAILLYFYCTSYFSTNTEELVPDDPTSPLPPSASKLRVFKKAAVCVDSGICAEVGR